MLSLPGTSARAMKPAMAPMMMRLMMKPTMGISSRRGSE
jgi:hypothetical protein